MADIGTHIRRLDSSLQDTASIAGRSSVSATESWADSEHDYDSKTTAVVQGLFNKLERELYAGDLQAAKEDECSQWKALFPHMRLEGKVVVPSTDLGFELLNTTRPISPYFYQDSLSSANVLELRGTRLKTPFFMDCNLQPQQDQPISPSQRSIIEWEPKALETIKHLQVSEWALFMVHQHNEERSATPTPQDPFASEDPPRIEWIRQGNQTQPLEESLPAAPESQDSIFATIRTVECLKLVQFLFYHTDLTRRRQVTTVDLESIVQTPIVEIFMRNREELDLMHKMTIPESSTMSGYYVESLAIDVAEIRHDIKSNNVCDINFHVFEDLWSEIMPYLLVLGQEDPHVDDSDDQESDTSDEELLSAMTIRRAPIQQRETKHRLAIEYPTETLNALTRPDSARSVIARPISAVSKLSTIRSQSSKRYFF